MTSVCGDHSDGLPEQYNIACVTFSFIGSFSIHQPTLHLSNLVTKMSRGKYKRKREHAEERARKKEDGLAFDRLIMTTGETETNSKAANKVRPNKEDVVMGVCAGIMHIRNAIWRYLKIPSFTDYCLTAFTLVLAVTAILQYQTMDGQLSMMRIDQRAWIKVKQPGGPQDIVSGKNVVMPLTFENFGKTAATQIVAAYSVQFMKANQLVPLACVEYATDGCAGSGAIVGTLMPTESSSVGVRWQTKSNVEHIVTDEEAQAWNSGTAYVAVFGIIFYNDVFANTQHFVRFCSWISKAGTEHMTFSASDCTRYNSVDGEYPEQDAKTRRPRRDITNSFPVL